MALVLNKINILRCGRFISVLQARYSSALYVTGDKASQTTSVLTPHIDLDKKFQEMDKLQENVCLRKLEIDPIKLKSLFDFLKNLETTKMQLEKRRIEIADHMKDLKKIGNDSEAKQEMEKLKIEGRIVREDLKTLMKAFWDVEEKVMLTGLSLPNELHKDTPEKEDKIIHQFLERPHLNQVQSHIEIGNILDILDYRDPSWVYFKNKAADFELGLGYYFADELKKHEFIQFCNPDTARSVVVEGCGTDHTDPNSVFLIDENVDNINKNFRLHLVGGASIYPFCAYHAKQKINFSSLPLRYFTNGRQYNPSNFTQSETEDTTQNCPDNLFNTWQSTACEIFILTAANNNEMMSEFTKIVKTVENLYETLGYHFRVVYLHAGALNSWESLRASFQMYSCHEQKYIEVGKISISDDYICQRLLMSYVMTESDDKVRFMKMISGTVFDFPKVLGCVVEQKLDDKFEIPKCLDNFIFGF